MRPSSARNLDARKRVLRAPACHCLLMTSRETLYDKSTRVFPDGKKFLTNTINTEETPAPLSKLQSVAAFCLADWPQTSAHPEPNAELPPHWFPGEGARSGFRSSGTRWSA